MWTSFLLQLCAAHADPGTDAVAAEAPEQQAESWLASWYGERFRGRPTANGEPYDPDGLTAAHRTLPFNTLLRVTSPDTGVSVVVRINDRGPFIHGRSLDLSQQAAEILGLRTKGVGRVIVERLPDKTS